MEENDQVKLYSDEDKHILKTAEDSLDSKLDRVEEIIEYAHEAGLKKIGIANCTVFNKEALLLSEILTENGFTVEAHVTRQVRLNTLKKKVQSLIL